MDPCTVFDVSITYGPVPTGTVFSPALSSAFGLAMRPAASDRL